VAAEAPQRRTQAERRNGSEDALLAAAAELIAERGIDRSTLAGIGERAGTSRGLPTHYFGTKDALVEQLAERVQDDIQTRMLDTIAERPGAPDEISGLERIRLSVDIYLELFEHPTSAVRALIVMWGATFPSEAAIGGMTAADRRNYEGWAELVTTGQNDGSVRTDVEAGPTAVLLTGMIRGVAALLLTDSDLTDMRQVRATCHAWITAALAPAGR
jgi:AcrR family transcriptional regulator